MAESQVTAAFITPDCVSNRGQDGAWDEAVARLKVEYDAVLSGWSAAPVKPTLNLRLMIERPEAADV